MTENMESSIQHTYDNWRKVTEADFVTLFIKTWFSFVATLRELYHDYAKPYYEAAGDKPFLSQYKNEFADNFSFLMKYSCVEAEMIHTYRFGLKMISKNYPRFLVDDFHRINQSFKEHYSEPFSSAGGYSGTLSLVVRSTKDNLTKADLICSDKRFLSKTGLQHVMLSVEINTVEILERIISEIEEKSQEIPETSLLLTFYQSFFSEVSAELFNAIEGEKNALPDQNFKQVKQVYSLMQAFCLRACENIKAQCLNPDIRDEHKYLIQVPIYEFTQNAGNLSFAEEQRAYLWFISFSYRLRNALFHEIIDPLDVSWQNIFKNAYLVLKHIVEANVLRLKTCALLVENAQQVFIQDFLDAPPPQIPDITSSDTTFTFEKVKLEYYNSTGAKVLISSVIKCEGKAYKVECNVRWNEGLKESKVKNVIIEPDEEPTDEKNETPIENDDKEIVL